VLFAEVASARQPATVHSSAIHMCWVALARGLNPTSFFADAKIGSATEADPPACRRS